MLGVGRICSSANWRTISQIAFCSSVFSVNVAAAMVAAGNAPLADWPVDTASLGSAPVNFARDVVEAAARERLALVERARDGTRREWSFGEVARAAAHALARALRRRRACAAATSS